MANLKIEDNVGKKEIKRRKETKGGRKETKIILSFWIAIVSTCLFYFLQIFDLRMF